MNRILLILLLLAPSTLHAASKPKVKVKDTQPSATFIDVGGHLLIESSGIVKLTKKGQRASYNVVGASKEGKLLLGLNPKVDEGAFKVQLAKDAKIKFIKPNKDEDIDDKNVGDVGGHLLVESTGIVTVWIDSWPPPKTNADKETNFLITKALSAGVRSGKIKLKKPPLTPEQRAKRR